MAEDLGERTEQPTGRRLIEARRKGQVARSANLSAFIVLAAGVALLYYFGDMLIRGMFVATRRALHPDTLAEALTPDTVFPTLMFSGVEAARMIAPILLIMMVVSIVEQIYQVGWFISTESLKPNWGRFNPVAGVKRLFSKRTAVKTMVDTLKLGVIVAVGLKVVSDDLDAILALPALTAVGAFREAGEILARLVIWILVILLIVGVADRMYQKWQHTQDLKMTKKEVQDERKTVEGDPHIKARRFRVAREMLKQNIRGNVPQADVVVTNPTHFAVAIKYDAATMNAPRVLAKGVDQLAIHIRLVAARAGVPIVERPPLARALYWGVEVGQEIPAEQFEAVAEVLAYVYRLEGRMAS
jgi:flagellar biosynthetic protein FlhB